MRESHHTKQPSDLEDLFCICKNLKHEGYRPSDLMVRYCWLDLWHFGHDSYGRRSNGLQRSLSLELHSICTWWNSTVAEWNGVLFHGLCWLNDKRTITGDCTHCMPGQCSVLGWNHWLLLSSAPSEHGIIHHPSPAPAPAPVTLSGCRGRRVYTIHQHPRPRVSRRVVSLTMRVGEDRASVTKLRASMANGGAGIEPPLFCV